MDYEDPFFADRGVSVEVAASRGYLYWDEETYRDVVEETFGEWTDAINGWAKYVTRQGEGYTIPRFAPDGYDAIVPGLRPSDPVKLGPPKRHLHPDVEPSQLTDLLPLHVELAYATPQRGQVKVYFEHSHGAQEEHQEHLAQFHTNPPREGSHGHTFYVVPFRDMRKHIAQTKNTDSHEGLNVQAVHAHQKRAKYLYAPSEKFEAAWQTEHDHEEMVPEHLASHLLKYHHEDKE